MIGTAIAIVVASAAGEGGTWAGATENLSNDWVPLWVRAGDGVPAGNTELLRRNKDLREERTNRCEVLLAERQTGGRGRRGRTWASPLAAPGAWCAASSGGAC